MTVKSTEKEHKLLVTGSGRRKNGEKALNGYGVSFWDDGNVLKLDRGVDYTTLWMD